jgi:hypothetical protein
MELGSPGSPGEEEVVRAAGRLGVTVKQVAGWVKRRREKEEQGRAAGVTPPKEKAKADVKKEKGELVELVKEEDHCLDLAPKQEADERRTRPSREAAAGPGYQEEEGEPQPKLPYNPGHKKTKFSEFQRNHLRQFFQVYTAPNPPLTQPLPPPEQGVCGGG